MTEAPHPATQRAADARPTVDTDIDPEARELAASVQLTGIAAVAANGVIGADGEMPWSYPEDLSHFKETTTGEIVILGRRTYESILNTLGEPFPNRDSIVLSETLTASETPARVTVASSIADALSAAADIRDAAPDEKTVFVAGGESVYAAFLPLLDSLILTRIPEAPSGDAYFPAIPLTAWTCRSVEQKGNVRIEHYDRPHSDTEGSA